MRIVRFTALLGLLAHWAMTAQAQTVAQVTANCRAVFLTNTATSVLMVFSTYDDDYSSPRYDNVNGQGLYSYEFRPIQGSTTDYIAGFVSFTPDGSSYTGYGSVVATMPTTDADTNGLADFCQKDQAVDVTVTGVLTNRYVLTPYFTYPSSFTATFGRTAGSVGGTWSVSTDSPAYGEFKLTGGRWEVRTFTGTLTFTRGLVNTAVWNLTLANAAGQSETYTNTCTFTVDSTNQLTMPQFYAKQVSTNGYYLTVLPSTFTRQGTKYLGTVSLADGNLNTSWADYTNWVFEITDSHDSNSNGIPDLTDEFVPCQFSLSNTSAALPPTGGTTNVTVTVTAGTDCGWSVTNACGSWLTILPTNGTGPTTVTLTATPNVTGSARGCTVTIAGQSLVVTQAAMLPPSIVSQPASQTANLGATVAFAVAASGEGTLTYQWYLSGGALTGATNAILALFNLQPAQAGPYTVVVSNLAGGTTSQVAVLTLNLPPTISSQPQSLAVRPGETATFHVGVTGTAPFTYRWQGHGADLAEGGRISGSASDTLVLAGTVTNDEGAYAVIVSNAWGAVTSAVASLTVSSNLVSYALLPTYCLVAVPVGIPSLTNAEALASLMTNCTGLWKWDAAGQGWIGHRKGGPNNFALNPGLALMVSVTAPGTLAMAGTWSPVTYSLKAGYNLVCLTQAHAGVTTAEVLVQTMIGCTGLWKWDASVQGWSGHRRGGPNNFAVQMGGVYLVYVTANSDW